MTQSIQARPIIQPYVSVSLSDDKLDLGTVSRPGVYDSSATITIHVAANIAHGGVIVSMAAPLDGPGNATIPLNRISVKRLNGSFTPLTAPVSVTGPMNPGIADVPINLRVETDYGNPPGTYLGTIVVTCGVAP
jgi:hypothetical protein